MFFNDIFIILYSRRESNSDLRFRKPLFYPLNYESKIGERQLKPTLCLFPTSTHPDYTNPFRVNILTFSKLPAQISYGLCRCVCVAVAVVSLPVAGHAVPPQDAP